jgi:tetratricopeptide (TPR) repeat protein
MLQLESRTVSSETSVTASMEGIALISDPKTGRGIGAPLRPQGPVMSLAFSPDGRVLATGSGDRVVLLWDAATGRLLGQPLRHRGPVAKLLFAPNGRLLLTMTSGGDLAAWEPQTGEPLGLLPENPGPVADIAFDPRERHFAVAMQDGQVLVYPMPKPPIGLREMELRTWLALGAMRTSSGSLKALTPGDMRRIRRELDDPGGARGQGRDVAQPPTPQFREAWWAHQDRAEVFKARKRWREVVTEYSRAIGAGGTDADLWSERGDAYGELGDWTRAAADHREALRRGATGHTTWYHAALLELAIREPGAYQRTRADMLRRFGDSSNPDAGSTLAWTFALAPAESSALTQPIRIAEKVVAGNPKDSSVRNTLGALLYRAGRYKEALQTLREAVALKKTGSDAYDGFFLAMTQHRLGARVEARRTLAAAITWLDRRLKSQPSGSGQGQLEWYDRLELEILRREVQALVNSPGR